MVKEINQTKSSTQSQKQLLHKQDCQTSAVPTSNNKILVKC